MLVAQLVDARTAGASTRLFIVTRNAQPVSEGDRANPAHAVLWGLGRTLALEHPEIWGGIIDLDEVVPAVLAARWCSPRRRPTTARTRSCTAAGARHVPRLERRPDGRAMTGLGSNSSHLVIGATGNIGPHLITQLARMGARPSSRFPDPGGRLDELADTPGRTGTTLIAVAADAADGAAMAALFDRFGADLPPLEGIYLAAFAGGPVTLAEMTDDDVNAMFRPKLERVAAAARAVAAHPAAPLRAVLLDLRHARLTLARPLHRNQPFLDALPTPAAP